MSSRLQLDMNFTSDLVSAESGADSPRSKIAERLKDLDLRPWDVPAPTFRPTGAAETRAESPGPAQYSSFSPRKRRKSVSRRRDGQEEDSAEVLPLHIEFASPPPPPQNERPELLPIHLPPTQDTDNLPSKSKRLHPFPSPSPMDEDSDADSEVKGYGHRTAATTTPSSPDRAALTWKDSEITGHRIDAASGDDDGEGINGIGFRPTPAMASARRQKRRQQVSEWKAREARDARQRRLDRRRGGGSISRDRSSSAAAGVRFEVRAGEMRPAGRVVRFV